MRVRTTLLTCWPAKQLATGRLVERLTAGENLRPAFASLATNAAYMDSSLVSARIRTRDQNRMQSYIRPLLKPRWLRAMMGIRAPRANQ
jgi:hypothetical protein